MAAFLGRTEIGIKKTGVDVTIPDNPKAKLMYYISCITSVLEVCWKYFGKKLNLVVFSNTQDANESN